MTLTQLKDVTRSADQFMEGSKEGANTAKVPLMVKDEDGTSHETFHVMLAAMGVVSVMVVLLLIASSARKRSS